MLLCSDSIIDLWRPFLKEGDIMYHDIYIKWKDKPEEELWLQSGYTFEIRFKIDCLLSNNEKEDKIEYIKIK